MKLIRFAAASLAVTLAALSGTAGAQATSAFKVDLSLTSKCYVNMVAGTPADVDTGDVTLTYTAFQTTDAKGSTSFNVTCTNTLPYSIAVTADSDTVAGIDYYLKVVAGTTPAYVSATGGGTLASLAGDGTAQSYSIGVLAPKDQAGTCTTATCLNVQKSHTITVTY